MSTVTENLSVGRSIPASRGLRWCVDGLRLWRRAPFKLFFLCLAQLLVELALQIGIPLAGVTLSKLVVPMLLMGILLGLHELAEGGRMRWSCLFSGFRCGRFLSVLGLAVIWGLGVFAIQQAVVWLVYDWPAIDVVWLGHAMAHRELMTPMFQRLLLTPGVLPMVLLLLAPGLLLFDGRSPWRAAGESIRTVLRHWVPCTVFLLVLTALFLLMTLTTWTGVLVLFLIPWYLACMHVVWKDLRDESLGA